VYHFTELERQQASDSDGNDADGHRVAEDVTRSQISLSLSGFVVRTDWRNSDSSTMRRHPTSRPPPAPVPPTIPPSMHPTHAASSAMPYEHVLTVILVS
jgi:hypothetical protein